MRSGAGASSVCHDSPHELGGCSAALAVAAHVNDIDLLNRLVIQGANVNLEHPYFGNGLRTAAAR